MAACPFYIISIFVGLIGLSLSILNGIIFFRLKNGKSIRDFDVQLMFWVSVFLSIGFILFLAWACYHTYISCGVKEKATNAYSAYQYGVQNMPPNTPPPPVPSQSIPPPLPSSQIPVQSNLQQ